MKISRASNIFWAQENPIQLKISVNFLFSTGIIKSVQLRSFLPQYVAKFVQFKNFLTRLISIQLRGPFSWRSFISRPYCTFNWKLHNSFSIMASKHSILHPPIVTLMQYKTDCHKLFTFESPSDSPLYPKANRQS